MSTFERFTCSICLGWLNGSKPSVATNCGHVFHKLCFRRVPLGQGGLHKNCPMCRQNVAVTTTLFFSTASFDQSAEDCSPQEEVEQDYPELDEHHESNDSQGRLPEEFGDAAENFLREYIPFPNIFYSANRVAGEETNHPRLYDFNELQGGLSEEFLDVAGDFFPEYVPFQNSWADEMNHPEEAPGENAEGQEGTNNRNGEQI